MAVILWPMVLALLIQGSLCSLEKTTVGCKKWQPNGDNVCCEECHAGNRLVKECGPLPANLCKPCEAGSFTVNAKDYRCSRCTLCVGVQVQLESCTATSNTKCGCKEGYVCGNDHCSFCTEKCDKGQEPTSDRSCRPCPNGTYNDKGHQKCKPWSNKCPSPDQVIVAKGNATSDILCVSHLPVTHSKKPNDADQALPFVIPLIIGTVLMASFFIIIIIMALRFNKKEKKPENPDSKTPIIRPPTDDPRTLIAVECSFNEAQQEQGSSTESLISKGPAGQLIV
ncbi:tumor necrosis factor receptor superfamily member 9a [Melanotaenia boesemani]|uniref:tumor necrosis factor receptor superfamily member 9a n=1 Tax=Melanotaenia boesemani TaxID=1250792 RepID=UPI001C049CB4|nr:tumor necrosis factor receptor superfamily member 9a [Melanotaenia boesemani]